MAQCSFELSNNNEEATQLINGLPTQNQSNETYKPGISEFFKEVKAVILLGGPASFALSFDALISLITLVYVGPLGHTVVAVAALATQLTLSPGLGMVMLASADAVATYTSQAVGAKELDKLPIILQRGFLFNLVHSIPLILLLYFIPQIFGHFGRSADFVAQLHAYQSIMSINIVLQALLYPLHSAIASMGITVPQMVIGGATVLVHVALNHLLIFGTSMGYLGAAVARTASMLFTVVSLFSYVYFTSLRKTFLTKVSLSELVNGVRQQYFLAYYSIVNKGIEFYSYTGLSVLAGFLPNGTASQAATSVSFEILMFIYVIYAGISVAVTTRVGNFLGAGLWRDAIRSIRAGLFIHPWVWLGIAAIILNPVSLDWIINIFLRSTEGQTASIMRNFMRIVCFHGIADNTQVILVGAIVGAGLQLKALKFNIVAFCCVAYPTMYILGFKTSLGAVGLMLGLSLAPVVQCISYLYILLKADWQNLDSK